MLFTDNIDYPLHIQGDCLWFHPEEKNRLQQIPIMTLPMTTFITQRAQQTITINGERYTASEAKISASDGKSLTTEKIL